MAAKTYRLVFKGLEPSWGWSLLNVVFKILLIGALILFIVITQPPGAMAYKQLKGVQLLSLTVIALNSVFILFEIGGLFMCASIKKE